VQVARGGEIHFEYIKSNSFRVVHVDGIHGGPTPDGNSIHMAMFNERLPISQEEIYSISSEGKLGALKSKVSRKGIVREVEVSAILSLKAARALHGWLVAMLAKAEQIADVRAKAQKKLDTK
jgi:hypothetical protein